MQPSAVPSRLAALEACFRPAQQVTRFQIHQVPARDTSQRVFLLTSRPLAPLQQPAALRSAQASGAIILAVPAAHPGDYRRAKTSHLKGTPC